MENDYKKVQSQLKILEDKLQTEINKETEQSNEYKKILLDRENGSEDTCDVVSIISCDIKRRVYKH